MVRCSISGASVLAKNIYIEGDNLEVLKCLRESYLGKVKVIYIDPPYNTGTDFIYRDNFSESKEGYLSRSGQTDKQGNFLISNLETNGRFHTDWLNMIYPRLKVARDFLSEDGVIFISIDDNELYSTKLICDELFGSSNFLGNLVIQTATDNNPTQVKVEHEYIICYAKNKVVQQPWSARSEKIEIIMKKYESLKRKYGSDVGAIQQELRAWIRTSKNEIEGFAHYDNVDEKGVFHDGDIANTTANGYRFEVIHPKTGRPCKIPPKGFRFPEESLRKMIADGDIMFGEDETTLIKPKKRLENAKDVLRSVIYEDGRSSTKAFEALMGKDIFQNPKSPTVLSRLFGFVLKDEDIVLDFFSGSGTTAEAVLMCNEFNEIDAKFILIQLPVDLDESMAGATKKAKQTTLNAIKFLDSIGKPHNLAEIGKERIHRLIKDRECVNLFNQKKNGCRMFKLATSNMRDVELIPEKTSQGDLFSLSNNVKTDRTAEDLLFQVMLSLGATLDCLIERKKIGGKEIFKVDEGYILACFDCDVTDEVIESMAKEQPRFIVIRDACFKNDSVADNFEQIFKTYAPNTVCKVI